MLVIHLLVLPLLSALVSGTSSNSSPSDVLRSLECHLSSPVTHVPTSERPSCDNGTQRNAYGQTVQLDGLNDRLEPNETSPWNILDLLDRLDPPPVHQKNLSRHLHHPFLLTQILSLADSETVNPRCLADIHHLMDALDEGQEIWPLKGR